MIPTEVLISIVVLSLISGIMCAQVPGDKTVHLSAKIRTGSYDNITAIEFATEIRLSLFQCIKKCEATKACMFVNYDRRMKTCHLIECDECSLVQSVQYKGVCFWNKSESTLTEEATCESCMVHDICATNQNPQCIPQGCGVPEPMSHTVRKGNMYLTNSRVKYECANNLTLIGNVTYITCQNDGYWTPMEFSCGYCPPPPEKPHAVIVGNGYDLGDEVAYACKEQFSMIESVSVYESTCQIDETWSPVNFSCVGCGTPVEIQNSIRIGKSYAAGHNVSYICQSNFSPIPSSPPSVIITCETTGIWTNITFQCDKNCDAPITFPNANIVGISALYTGGDVIHYECEVAYKMLEGNVSFSVCLSNGSWSQVQFQCLAICDTPINLPNATIVGNSSLYTEGHVIRYECDEAFNMLPGNVSNSHCLSTGSWSSVSFQCIAICGTPINLPNATIVGNSSLYTEGHVIHYECDEAFKMLPGNVSNSHCLSTGSWSLVSFQCIEVCVPKAPVTYTDVVSGGVVLFRYFVVTNEKYLNDTYTNCVDLCGTLLQIADTDKFTAMQSILAADEDYKEHSYWIDGYFNSTESKWRTKTGVIIPQTSDLWKHAQSMDGSPPCVNMEHGSHFQLYDTECSGFKRSICEQPESLF